MKELEGDGGQRTPSYDESVDSQNKMPRASTHPVEISKADREEENCHTATHVGGVGKKPPRPFSLASNNLFSSVLPSAVNASWATGDRQRGWDMDDQSRGI